MARRISLVALATSVIALIVTACGAAATPIPSAASAASQVAVSSPAGASAAASEAQPSTAASSGSEASGGAPSIALPSISLPSDAKDLEALLPGTLCGSTATKASVSGANLGQTVDPTFLSTLQALGKSVNDVAFAFAFAQTSGCGAGIFRINGVDQNALQSAMVAQQQKSGDTFTQGNVGGKAVFISDASSGGGKQYVYFHGDAVIFAQAPDDTKAATILQALP